MTTTEPLPLPATLVSQKDALRSLLADRRRQDEQQGKRALRAAWCAALEAAARVLPPELFGQIPTPQEMPDTFDGRDAVLTFTFADHHPIHFRLVGNSSGDRWLPNAFRQGEGRIYDPLHIGGSLLYLADVPGDPRICPDLPSALVAAEVGTVVLDDDGEG